MNKRYLYCTALSMLVFSAAFGMDDDDHAEPQKNAAAPLTLQVILEAVQQHENDVQAIEDILARKAAVEKPEGELQSLKDHLQRLKKMADDGLKHKALAQGEDFNGTPEQRREFTKQVEAYEQEVLGIYPEQDKKIRELVSLVAILARISINKGHLQAAE